jgi:methylmalonyl-CoA mutase N-terminal domain/subunit
LLREEFGCSDKAARLRFHCQTAGSTLTAQQPTNNAVRVSIQALSSVLGGTQSLHTNSIDEALGLPTSASARLALRTQQIIEKESGITEHIDPFAGSYIVEELTDRYIQETRELWQTIEQKGGVLECINSGILTSWIQDSAYKTQKEIERGDKEIVGVNIYKEENEPEPDIFEIDSTMESSTVAHLKKYKENRNNQSVDEALDHLAQVARSQCNIIPAILNAAEKKSTLGEICGCLKNVFKTFQPVSGL